MRDVPADKATVIEGEFELKPRQVIVFSGWTLPSVRDLTESRKGLTIDGYAGPGLAVEWVEVEGPLDAWPPVGYERLFPGVPLRATSVVKAMAAGEPPRDQSKRSPDSYIYDPLIPAPAKPREEARRLMAAFLPTAFRRPVPDALQQYYVKIVEAELDKKTPFAEAMIAGISGGALLAAFSFPDRARRSIQRQATGGAGRLCHRGPAVVFPLVVNAG